MKILLVAPPIQETNTPYGATTTLTGFLRSRGHDVAQDDFSIRLISRILSRAGVSALFEDLKEWLEPARGLSELAQRSPVYAQIEYFLAHHEHYEAIVDQVAQYLRGSDPTLRHRILRDHFFPESPWFRAKVGEFENNASDDHQLASRYCTLFINGIYKLVASADPDFDQSALRYSESIAQIPSFTPLDNRLAHEYFMDRMIADITRERMAVHRPDLLGISVPFPGQFYPALRIAKVVKATYPGVVIAIGGGFCNTTLRDVSDARLFRYIDYLTLDDGERVIECLIEHLAETRPRERLLRTFALADGKVQYFTSDEADVPHAETGVPTYGGLPLDLYLPRGNSVEQANLPERYELYQHAWNKLMLAHGCYWRKCTFCDIHLDYIGRYDRAPAKLLVDRMQSMASETGWSGFHFTDEACPPSVLRALSHELRERNLFYAWWGNMRFDKAFTAELAVEMARAGCIAVTGGLEIASDRLLKLMDKGITVEQVTRVCRAFRDANINVHAYLMYGFPSQTDQEIVDSLEVLRQFFANGLLCTAAWHRFTATNWSPIGRTPERFGVTLKREPPSPYGVFTSYTVEHETTLPQRYDQFSEPLFNALKSFERGIGLDQNVTTWFQPLPDIPESTVPPDLIKRYLSNQATPAPAHRHLPLVS